MTAGQGITITPRHIINHVSVADITDPKTDVTCATSATTSLHNHGHCGDCKHDAYTAEPADKSKPQPRNRNTHSMSRECLCFFPPSAESRSMSVNDRHDDDGNAVYHLDNLYAVEDEQAQERIVSCQPRLGRTDNNNTMTMLCDKSTHYLFRWRPHQEFKSSLRQLPSAQIRTTAWTIFAAGQHRDVADISFPDASFTTSTNRSRFSRFVFEMTSMQNT